MSKSGRVHYIDIAKAFAIFYIALGHTIIHSAHTYSILRFVCSFHVVLFFVLSGYTFKIKNDSNFWLFFKNKFIRIIVPYILWTLIYLIPYMIFGSDVGKSLGTMQSFDLKEHIINIIYGNGANAALKQNSSLWFLPALFTIEMIYYCIIKYSRDNYIKEIIILFCLLLLGFLSVNYLKIVFPFGFNTALNVGIFFYIGYLSKEWNLVEKYSNFFLSLFLFVIGLFACFYGNSNHISYIDFYYGNYFFTLLSGFCFSFFTIFMSKNINTNSILEYVGRNTMGLLIFHKIVIIIFQTKMGIITQLLINSNFIVEIFLGGSVVIISFIFSLALNKLVKMYCPFMIGEK